MKTNPLKAMFGRILVWAAILGTTGTLIGAESAVSGDVAAGGVSTEGLGLLATLVHPYTDWLVLLALLMFFGICWHENENHR
ncbi:MAG TPA: hypothetical protein VMS21_05390 [Methylomirabilota bacterium]|nr:hypothetical protein [Methylomirabilota bacterium]